MSSAEITRNKTFSFRTNSELMEQAKEVAKDYNFDMSSLINMFLLKVVETKQVPTEFFETEESRDKAIAELFSELQGSYEYFLSGGKGKSLDEVFSEYGV